MLELGFLVRQGWVSFSIGGGVLNLVPCPGRSVEQSPWPVQPSCLGTWIRQKSPLNSLARSATCYAQQMVRAVDWDPPLSAAFRRNEFCQHLRIGCSMHFPTFSISIWSSVSSPRNFLSDPCEVRPKWASWEAPNKPHNAGKAGFPPWGLYSSLEKIGPGVFSWWGTMLAWGRSNVVRV